MKTQEEIQRLKDDWVCAPCWDLYDTEGFEEYKKELKIYQAEMEKKWRQQEEKRVELKAKDYNLSNNTVLLLEKYEIKAAESADKAKELLHFYFKNCLSSFNDDNQKEIDLLVDQLISSAIFTTLAEIVKLNNKLS